MNNKPSSASTSRERVVTHALRGRFFLEDIILEDSEPERQVARQIAKEKRRQEKNPGRREKAAEPSRAEIIVLTDSDGEQQKPTSVINISDDIIPSFFALGQSATGTHPSPELVTAVTPESEPEEGQIFLGLEKFAFVPGNKGPSFIPPEYVPRATIPVDRRAIATSSRYSFTEPQLRSLNKCVCCEIAWTSRKSVEKKVIHIRKCAKTQNFTDDTVKTLIEKELARIQAEEPSRPKGKIKTSKTKSGESPAPITFLEEVVNKAAPKRRRVGPRQDAELTVKPLTEVGEEIRQRARILFDAENDNMPPPTQVFAPSRLGRAFASTSGSRCSAESELPTTQPFGASKLGSLYQKQATSYDSAEPALTQSFAPNKLGHKTTLGFSSVWSPLASPRPVTPVHPSPKHATSHPLRLAHDHHHTSHPVDDRAQSVLTLPPLPTSLVNAGELVQTMNGIHQHLAFDLESTPDNNNTWEMSPTNDDAVLLWDPCQSSPISHATRHRAGSLSNSEEPPMLAKQKTKKKSAKKIHEVAERKAAKLDHALDQELSSMIMEDEALYLQILRYEPIDFEVFVEGTRRKGIDQRGLRVKLHQYLDQQCIHFYGAVVSRSRRR